MRSTSNPFKKVLYFMFDSSYRTAVLRSRGAYDNMSDKDFLKKIFKAYMGKELDLENPKTFNEKLQWLKLYDRKPEYITMADKYKVREYISEKLGGEYLIPLIGAWDDPDEIDFDALPDKFVLKCNHNSGLGMCICTDKTKLNIEKVRNELRKGISENYYLKNREWPYKDVPRKIIAEKFMIDDDTGELRDYKFFCFDGKVDCVMVCMERMTGDTKFYFFNSDWELLRLNIRGKNAPEGFTLPKPSNMDEMFDIAAKLSRGLPFSRIDLYSVNGKTYFGEITFFPDSGFDKNLLSETDARWGEMLDISKVKTEDSK